MCETDAWGWSGYLLHKELSGLDTEVKDKRNVGGKEGLDRRNKITCLPAFLCGIQKKPVTVYAEEFCD